MSGKDGGFLLPEVLDPPTRCVMIEVPDDQNHMMAFWGALNELTYWFNWQRDVAHTATQVAYKWQLLIQAAHDRFLSENPCGNEITEDCVELAPHHPAVEWYPKNPYTQPGEKPSGYLLAPFSVVNLDTIGPIDPAYLAGLQNGDVITTLLSIPSNPLEVLSSGLPRFVIRVNGVGTVNLNLVNLPFGGQAAIGKDTYVDIPGLLTGVIGGGVVIVDLNRDVISIPPETSTIVGYTVEFDEPGPHFVEVAFVPNVNDSGTPVTFGGGLRSFLLCGFEPTEVNHVIRVQDCVLQQSADGVTWTDIYDLATCAPEPVSNTEIREYLISDTTFNEAICESVSACLPASEPNTGNVYPPAPTPEQPDQLCNAAYYIIKQVRDVIVDVYSKAATLDVPEIVMAFLNQGGWSFAALYELAVLAKGSLASEVANLAEYDAAKKQLAQELIAFNLDKLALTSWMESAYSDTPGIRDLIIASLNAASTDGRYASWVATGALQDDAACEEIDPNCVGVDYNVQTEVSTGKSSGVYARTGDKISVVGSGTYAGLSGGGPFNYAGGSDNPTPAGEPWVAPLLPVQDFIVRQEGDVWRNMSSHGSNTGIVEWTATGNGYIRVAINQYTYLGGWSGDTVGTIHFDVCIERAEIKLIPAGYPVGVVVRHALNVWDIKTYNTGNAGVAQVVSVGLAPFRIVDVEVISGDFTGGSFQIGGQTFTPETLDDTAIGTGIGIYNVGPDRVLRFTVEAV